MPSSAPLLCRFTAPLAGCTLLLLAAAAGATSVVTFDQPGSDGFNHGLGLSESQALASGVPIFDAVGDQLFTVLDEGDPLNSPLLVETGLESFQVTSQSQPAEAVQSWQITNQTGDALSADLVFVFQRPLDNSLLIEGVEETYEYELGEVSLDLDNGFDWLLLSVDAEGSTWYYPAVRIGPLEIDEALANPFEMDLILDNPEIFLRPDEEIVLGLPDWQVRAAFVVPEPSTALLVALGCAALALRAPRRA